MTLGELDPHARHVFRVFFSMGIVCAVLTLLGVVPRDYGMPIMLISGCVSWLFFPNRNAFPFTQPKDSGASYSAPPPSAVRVEVDSPTNDVKVFLDHAGIRAWPCSQEELDKGRKRALAKLHPDRMGDGSAAMFNRAVRGYEALSKALKQMRELDEAMARLQERSRRHHV